MSAIAFVVKSARVEILTDSLGIDTETGRAADLASKQVFIGTNAVIATQGWSVGCDMFTNLAAGTCGNFDDLLARLEWLWDSVTGHMLAQFPDDRFKCDPFTYYIAVAGWSHARKRPEVYMMDSFTGDISGRPITAFAMGGGPESMPDVLQFIRRFHTLPETFNARLHGVPLFEKMRGSMVEVGDQLCHAVGGSLQHTVVTADGIRDSIIHAWPDRVGELVKVA